MAENRPQPYVGISGIARWEQHVELVDIAQRERVADLGHFVMIGVQATGKTQVLDIPNKRGQLWHPVGDSIADAAANEDSGLTKPFVHCYFADEHEQAVGVENVMRRTAAYVQGVQFNQLPWIDKSFTGFFYGFRDKYPSQNIVLQTNRHILDTFSPIVIVDYLEMLTVDYVLLDPSGGFGELLDPAQLFPIVDEIYQRQLPMGVVVAGGLEAANVDAVFGPLVEEFPEISCDAEGRLRKGPEGSTVLDMKAAEEFIVAWRGCVLARQDR